MRVGNWNKILLLLLAFGTVLPLSAADPQDENVEAVLTELMGKEEGVLSLELGKEQVKIVMEAGVVTYVSIDGELAGAADLEDYLPEMLEMRDHMDRLKLERELMHEQHQALKYDLDRLRQTEVRMRAEELEKLRALEREVSQVQAQALKQMSHSRSDMEKMEHEERVALEKAMLEKRMAVLKQRKELMSAQHEARDALESAQVRAMEERLHLEQQRRALLHERKLLKEERRRFKALEEILLDEGILTEDEDFSLLLDVKQGYMEVNGVQQSEEVYLRFLQRYEEISGKQATGRIEIKRSNDN